jgi:hypothetical protein
MVEFEDEDEREADRRRFVESAGCYAYIYPLGGVNPSGPNICKGFMRVQGVR